MTAPRFGGCKCGHAEIVHEGHGLEPQCGARGCECLAYAPATPRRLPQRTQWYPLGADATIEQVLGRAMASKSKPLNWLAARINEMVQQLRQWIAEYESRVVVAPKLVVAAPEEDPAESSPVPETSDDAPPAKRKRNHVKGHHPCTREGCERVFETSQARALHERRTHDGFNPLANKSAAS